MVGVNGNKFTAIRAHLEQNIAQVYKDLDISYVSARPASESLWSLEPFFQLRELPWRQRDKPGVLYAKVVLWDPSIILIFT